MPETISGGQVLARLTSRPGVQWPKGSLMDPLNVQAVVYRENEHYVAQCLYVDVSSFGDTEEEALANLQERGAVFRGYA